MTLRQLFDQAGVVPDRIEGDAPVGVVVQDSRKVKPGDVYVAAPSASRDTHDFIPQVKAAGAGAVVAHSTYGFEAAREAGLPAALVTAALRQGRAPKDEGELKWEEAAWRLAKVSYGHPTASMKVVGVTGTNGKTTTAWLMRDMLAGLGLTAGYLGTLGFHLPGEERELANTTPFAIELSAMLAEARDRGVQALAMEVSSHALTERRADGVEFDVAVFTNLTQDHLDYHGTMDAYGEAKYRLFSELPKQSAKAWRAALNADDPVGHAWSGRLPDALTFGLERGELRGTPQSVRVDRIEMGLQWASGPRVEGFVAPLGGGYNVENLMAATAGLLAAFPDLTLEEIRLLWSKVRAVPGRFEPVANDAGIGILIDYAHTPDALEKLLDAVRPLTSGKVITVFGCGGDRDATKRPLMARAASSRSDLTIVTSDNPRTEDPQKIIADILPGILPSREVMTILDRREAVREAIAKADSGDVVVIAGKGHENYQIIGTVKFPMDDRELAREALAARS